MHNNFGLDGKIQKLKDGSIKISILNEPNAANFEGVECKNPDSPKENRVYTKTFHNKTIYLSDEYNKLISEKFNEDNMFIMSLNGYSSITPDQRQRYGIKEGDYEEACKALGRSITNHLRKKFKKAQIVFTYGSSNMGVDKAVEEIAKEFDAPIVGFSCPRYMLYAKDDNTPVYVAQNKDEYSNSYIRSLDLLISTGGREQTLKHDVLAACVYNKRIHFIDVLNSLSSTGGVPATIINENGSIRVDNAAAAMGRNISFFTRQEAAALAPANGDIWDSILSNVNGIATSACRQKMPSEYKFTDS